MIQLEYTTFKERHTALKAMLTEALRYPDKMDLENLAQDIEILFKERCPKCLSLELETRQTIVGYSLYCADCGTIVEVAR